jgi:hypothetical protein
MGWRTEVTILTSVDFVSDESYHFLGSLHRLEKADENYLIFIGTDLLFVA